jgi:hypothetical protein
LPRSLDVPSSEAALRVFILPLVIMTTALPVYSGECASLVTSVCAETVDQPTPGRKVIKLKPSETPYKVGDTFPVGTRSLLMDPARYDLEPSDGTWRYYAMGGIVYRVENVSGRVLKLIRTPRTAHLR